MEFSLPDELINQIIFSMEDQNGLYVLDSEKQILCLKTEETESNNDRYYELPLWNSVNGFRVMERFVLSIHNPLAREELRAVLQTGKGVFRNYKNVLKNYPEVERLWFSFKEKEIRRLIFLWYNALRESWGLEKLSEEIEDTEDILHDDFIFRVSEEQDETLIEKTYMRIFEEIKKESEKDLGDLLASLWYNNLKNTDEKQGFSVIAETIQKEFTGLITAIPYPQNAKRTVILPVLYVEKKYRGLGIGKELISHCMKILKDYQIHWVVIASVNVPQEFVPILYQNGFCLSGTGYIADLYTQS